MRAPVLLIILVLTAGSARAGETACRFERGAIVVPAAFGDIAGDFVLDASAPKSQLHLTVAESWGMTAPSARASLRLAGERLTGFEIEIADLDARSRLFTAGLAGVIGADVLDGFVTQIQTSPCRVRLSRTGLRRASIRLLMRRVDGIYAVRAAISDGATSRMGWFAIDTGSPGVKVADARLTRNPPTGGDADWPPARLRALSLGGLLFEQIPAGLIPNAPPDLAGSIGEVVWSRYRMRLDPARGWLELSPMR